MAISKKRLREVGQSSVFIEVMREYLEPNQDGGFFFDNAPDMWGKEERRLFDMAAEIEHRLKEQVTAIIEGKQPK